jgi:hypothetical protein
VLRAGLALFCIGLLGLSYALGLFDARYQGGTIEPPTSCMPRRFSRPVTRSCRLAYDDGTLVLIDLSHCRFEERRATPRPDAD